MVSVYSKNLQIFNAERFLASVESDDPYVYFAFAKPDPWTNEAIPPQANTTIASYIDLWKNMIGVKRVQGNDVRLGIRRIDWTYGETYTQYDDQETFDMNDENNKFYVLTDEWNVYKCIGNNNGRSSTIKPTSTITSSAIETSDKYVWKYMYTLTDEERMRFVTDKFIPVKSLREDNGALQWQVQTDAVQGAIESVKVISGGTGYSGVPTITITGDGQGASAIARIDEINTSIESIILTNRGSGYTYANVSITGTGTGASFRAIMSPRGGHGSDPAEELGASYAIVNVRLRGTEDGILNTENDFRQVALIKNPKLRNSNVLASNLAYSQTMTVIMTGGTSEYQQDEYVYQGASLETASFKGIVASWTSAENKLELVNTVGQPSSILIGNVSRTARQVQSTTEKDLEPYTGSLLYMNNIKAIQRADDQTEDFKIVISF